MQVLKDKIVFVSGASSGIGSGCAEAFAQAGAKLILCARSIEKISQLAEDLKKQYQVDILTLKLDVQDKNAVNAAIDSLPPEWQDIDILINNAGTALGSEKLYAGNTDDWDAMIDTNIKGLLYLTRKIVPTMVKNKRGHVFNLGSIAGIFVSPTNAVYCASKVAVKFISDGLRMEIVDTPIRVTNIQPGLVHTNISMVKFHGDQKKADEDYAGITPMQPIDIANIIVFAASAPPHVQICEVTVTATHQATGRVMHREIK